MVGSPFHFLDDFQSLEDEFEPKVCKSESNTAVFEIGVRERFS